MSEFLASGQPPSTLPEAADGRPPARGADGRAAGADGRAAGADVAAAPWHPAPGGSHAGNGAGPGRPEGPVRRALPRSRAALARHWLILSVVALATSGLMAFGVVAGRVPFVARHWTDADFANRLLVVHVDLGVVVWFSALPVALFHLYLMVAGGSRRAPPAATLAPWVATAGALVLLAGLVPGLGSPHAVNYIPLVSHPLYVTGLALFFGGVAMSFVDPRLIRDAAPGRVRPVAVAGGAPLPDAVTSTLRACAPLVRLGALFFLLALVALGFAYLRLPEALAGEARSEVLMWGPGHVLQYVNVAFAIVAWGMLAAWWSGRPITDQRRIRWVAGALALSIPPILFLMSQDPATAGYRAGFTALMKWGLFPAMTLFLAAVLVPHHRASRRDPRGSVGRGAGWALLASVVLMLVGFLFGALIRGSDLRIPGHYHASIGAVTLGYMALTLLVPGAAAIRRSGRATAGAVRGWGLTSVALLYGTGQLVFSAGLFVAGSYGLGRKLYGVEQHLESVGQGVGLGIMAVGGVLALAGGATWALAALRRMHALIGSERRDRDPCPAVPLPDRPG